MLEEEPNFTSASGFFGVTLSSARSALVSLPMIFSTVSVEPSWKLMIDFLGAFDDVIIGDDQAFLAVDDEARTER